MFNIYKIFLLIFTSFLFVSCAHKTPKKYYNIKNCENEMLNAVDYNPDDAIDHIVVDKKKRAMYLYKNGKVVSMIPVSLGKNPLGTKIQQGDKRTPEGEFWISRKLCSKRFYRSLCISYPRPQDIALARKRGVNPGGNITIHAQPPFNASGDKDTFMLARNWTDGCVAVTNRVMDDLWYAVREGVPITIR